MFLDEICAIIPVFPRSRRDIMYDDYEMDYTYCNDHAEYEDDSQDMQYLDEDYARDSQDYDALAYRHYA